jgi:TetR/AcrR family fatty acid metabolism transcriptional regulator
LTRQSTDPRPRRDGAGFEARRRQILRAAARVFARKGFAGTRVGDIAQEAGIAYGLIYHYFENKDAILACLFEDNWAVTLKVVDDIDRQGGSLRQKLRSIAGFFLEAWRLDPDLVDVLMREVVRSPRFLERRSIEAFQRIFDVMERILAAHRERGELRPAVDPRLAAFQFVGSLEILLTGFVARELLAEDPKTIESCREAVVDGFLYGVAGA